MWYEYQMINECLDSVQNALELAQEEVRLRVCLNRQTYLEKYDYRICGNLDTCNHIHEYSLYVGNHTDLTREQIINVCKKLNNV